MLTQLSKYDSTHHNKHRNNILAPLMYTELQFTHFNLRPCHIVIPSDSTEIFCEIGLELFVTWRSIGRTEDEADMTSFEELLSIFTGKLKPPGLYNGFPQTYSNRVLPDATHTHTHKLVCSIRFIRVKFVVPSTMGPNFNPPPPPRLKLPFC